MARIFRAIRILNVLFLGYTCSSSCIRVSPQPVWTLSLECSAILASGTAIDPNSLPRGTEDRHHQPMWNHLSRVIGSSWSSSTRGKVARRHRRSSQPQRRFECLETRHLLAASPLTFSQASFVHLNPISVTENTGEKPESKLWQNGGHWWSVMPDSSGTWIWRLDGSTWSHVLQLSTQNSFHADVLSQGTIAQILLFDSSNTQLATVEYVAGGAGSYSFWSQRQSLTPVGLSSSAEAATIAVDSAGRLWVASDVSTTVEVRYSDGVYSSFSAPITIGSGISTDDISDITMLPDGSVGVLWSNQSSKRFYFRTHQAGTDASGLVDHGNSRRTSGV